MGSKYDAKTVRIQLAMGFPWCKWCKVCAAANKIQWGISLNLENFQKQFRTASNGARNPSYILVLTMLGGVIGTSDKVRKLTRHRVGVVDPVFGSDFQRGHLGSFKYVKRRGRIKRSGLFITCGSKSCHNQKSILEIHTNICRTGWVAFFTRSKMNDWKFPAVRGALHVRSANFYIQIVIDLRGIVNIRHEIVDLRRHVRSIANRSIQSSELGAP